MASATEMSPAEWEVMRVIWTKGQAGSSEIVAVLQAKRDWAESTIKTLLRRLVKKQILTTTTAGRMFVYHPQVSEKVAMAETTTELFDHLCAMKKGGVLADLLTQTTLSQADIQRMQAILAAKLPQAPASVPCNCLGDNCRCEGECVEK
ncbi:MAG: CopY/TcrY family copper transport repressor [Lactobacillus sp.]|nr:CopY/TcrY family copper transport repressor [Lactobacillus sp.]MCI2032758.1 CopY/TcrY family copper transport repressor [Lactobacillus sp.]